MVEEPIKTLEEAVEKLKKVIGRFKKKEKQPPEEEGEEEEEEV